MSASESITFQVCSKYSIPIIRLLYYYYYYYYCCTKPHLLIRPHVDTSFIAPQWIIIELSVFTSNLPDAQNANL